MRRQAGLYEQTYCCYDYMVHGPLSVSKPLTSSGVIFEENQRPMIRINITLFVAFMVQISIEFSDYLNFHCRCDQKKSLRQ